MNGKVHLDGRSESRTTRGTPIASPVFLFSSVTNDAASTNAGSFVLRTLIVIVSDITNPPVSLIITIKVYLGCVSKSNHLPAFI